jgi:hypothetical protein
MRPSLDGKSLAVGVFAGATLVAAFGGMRAEPAPVADVLRARLIELVDGNGEARVQLFLGPDGSGNLRMRDATGNVRVKLGATKESAALILFDTAVDPVVEVTSDHAGSRLALRGAGKKERVLTPE